MVRQLDEHAHRSNCGRGIDFEREGLQGCAKLCCLAACRKIHPRRESFKKAGVRRKLPCLLQPEAPGLIKAPQLPVVITKMIHRIQISRIQVGGLFKLPGGGIPTPTAAVNITCHHEECRAIGQAGPCPRQFSRGALVIAIATKIAVCFGKVSFA